jgi:hypothetical protein
MRWMLTLDLACTLAGPMLADDHAKQKVKMEGTDPVNGDKVKYKSKSKVESDGDSKRNRR